MLKALIIAAGCGERLKPFTLTEPKPLMPLLGSRIIERIIVSIRNAGISEVVIVIGYLGKKIMDFLGDGSKYGVKIRFVENKFWRLGNGVSVYVARRKIRGRFLLLMADHVFDPKVLSMLKDFSSNVAADECVLCVDTRMKYVFDMDDATKVKIVNGRIIDIGKDLKDFNGIDMGIFLCSPIIFETLRYNIRRGLYTLTDAVKELARQGKMKPLIIDEEELFWIDIDTFKALEIATALLEMKSTLEKFRESSYAPPIDNLDI